MFPTVGDRSLRALRAGFIILPLLGIALWGWITWREAQGEAYSRAVNNAALLREYVQRLIQTQLSVLAAADAHGSGLDDGALASRGMHDFLARLEAGRSRSSGIAYVTPSGRFGASSRSFPAGGDVSDRAYFAAIRDGADFYVDRIDTRPSGTDVLAVAIRRQGEGFTGLFVSTLFLSEIRPFLEKIAAQPGDAASLVRSDGVVLVRHRPGPVHVVAPTSPMRDAMARGGSGTFETVATVDGVRRLYAYSQVERLPLFANFGTSTADVVRTWLADFLPKALFLAALGALGFAATAQTLRRVRADRERMVAVFRQQEAERVAELKDGMLRELNHRVKNNLQSIEALIRMRLRRKPAPELEDVAQRVWAIAEVHDLLYNSRDSQRVDLAAFIQAIASNPAIVPPESGVEVRAQTAPLEVDITRATPIALIIVEIVTNALKHAFPGRERGTVMITLRQIDGEGFVSVADDGVGLPETGARHSGLRLVAGMLDQIGGRMAVERDDGTVFRIRFPLAP